MNPGFSFSICSFSVCSGSFGLVGNAVRHINKVNQRQAGLVLRWVTVCGYTIFVFNQATQI